MCLVTTSSKLSLWCWKWAVLSRIYIVKESFIVKNFPKWPPSLYKIYFLVPWISSLSEKSFKNQAFQRANIKILIQGHAKALKGINIRRWQIQNSDSIAILLVYFHSAEKYSQLFDLVPKIDFLIIPKSWGYCILHLKANESLILLE